MDFRDLAIDAARVSVFGAPRYHRSSRVALGVHAALSQFPERSVAHHSGPRYAHQVCMVSPLMNNVITDAVT